VQGGGMGGTMKKILSFILVSVLVILAGCAPSGTAEETKAVEFKKHKKIHENFKATVGELVQRFEDSGSSENLSSDVNKILVRWLVNHIQKEDSKIGEHIKKTK